MTKGFRVPRRLALTSAAAALAMLPILAGVTAASADRAVFLRAADASRPVNASEAAAIAARIQARGPLPGYTAERAAIDRAAAAERARSGHGPAGAEGGGQRATQVPNINDPGQDADANNTSTPPDTTGAIGATRFIQLVNTRFGIYNRTNGSLIAEGDLNTLFGQPVNASSFDPQIIWDNQTQRFYYLGDTIRAANDQVLSFGWSTGPNPTNGSSAWCHFEVGFVDGTVFPDYPKLGDSQHFIIFGSNDFQPGFIGSTLWAVGKPPAGVACANPSTLPFGAAVNVRDGANARIFTPVPANDIDTRPQGFYVARNLNLPSSNMYVGRVTRAGSGAPVFETPRNLAVTSYTVPPSATQLGNTRLLDTLDARHTQAVMARNPDRAEIYSLWTQHTIRHATQARSVVRWYEINPFPPVPTVQRTGTLGLNATGVFYYNAAISPDRRADGAVRQFGDSFVINYNTSRAGSGGHNPRINVVSSFNGGAVTASAIVRSSPNANLDFSCPNATDVCRWGDYAAATPDPKPPAGNNRGSVWGTNQTAGPGASPGAPTWDTWFFAHRP